MTVIKTLIFVVVCVALGLAARDAYRRIAARVQSGELTLADVRWEWLLAAAIAYGISLLPPAWVLHQITGAMTVGSPHESPPRWSTSLRAQLLGHAGKYVPGKALVVVLRASMLRRDGMRFRTAATAVFVETFLMMAAGAGIASIVVALLPVPTWIRIGGPAAAMLSMVALSPPILIPLVRRVTTASPESLQNSLRGTKIAQAWLASAAAWLAIGLSFYWVTLAIPSASVLTDDGTGLTGNGSGLTGGAISSGPWLYAICLAAISLAMVFGFASLLPGGAGVRELTLLQIMALVTDPGHAMIAAVATRLIFMVVEGLLAAAAYLPGASGLSGGSGLPDEDSM